MIKKALIFLICSQLLLSCQSRSVVRAHIAERYYTGRELGLPDYYTQGEKQRQLTRRYHRIKYLLVSDKDNSQAIILKKAVSYIRSGSYEEAHILLEQVEYYFPAEVANNRAVIYEMSGDFIKARYYYIEACKKEPYNRYFRENFNTLETGIRPDFKDFTN